MHDRRAELETPGNSKSLFVFLDKLGKVVFLLVPEQTAEQEVLFCCVICQNSASAFLVFKVFHVPDSHPVKPNLFPFFPPVTRNGS